MKPTAVALSACPPAADSLALKTFSAPWHQSYYLASFLAIDQGHVWDGQPKLLIILLTGSLRKEVTRGLEVRENGLH